MNIKSIKNFTFKHTKSFVASIIVATLGVTSLVSVSTFAKDYKIVDGEIVVEVTIFSNEVYTAIDKAGIKLSDKDKVIIDESNPKITNVDIKRAFDVFVKVGNDTYQVKLADGTVQDVLDQLKISLNENDVIDVSLDQNVSPNMNININRVEFKEVSEQQEIPFSTETRNTNDLFKGETKTEKGENGSKVINKQEKYVDGVLVETKQISENVTKQAKNQINLVGTKEKPKKVRSIAKTSAPAAHNVGAPTSYSKVLTGVCTAYCGANNKLDGGPRTSTGKKVTKGIVAVDPRKIPYGTRLYIPGYGYAVAADTGGAMRSGKVLIDLGFDTQAECLSFGRRQMTIYVL